MARADSYTIIPLDRAAEILGINPLHFNTVTSFRAPIENSCDDIWSQYDWQAGGRLSRETFAEMLYSAEQTTAKLLGYFPAPVWIQAEPHVITKPNVGRTNVSGLNSMRQAKSFRADFGYVIAGGVRTKVFIDDPAIVYSDADGDGYKETATITFSTTVTDEQELRVYFPNEDGADVWEIRPVVYSLDTTLDTCTITFKREQVPLPDLWSAHNAPDDTLEINGDDDANFLTGVDVYRVYHDDSEQITFYTEPDPTCSTPLVHTTSTGVVLVRDDRRGICAYLPATYSQGWTQSEFPTWREPDKIEVNYRSGLVNRNMKYPYLQVDPMWERWIVYYALTLADEEICGCDNLARHVQYLSKDVAEATREAFISIPAEDLANPLGTKRAAIRLWKLIKKFRLDRGY